MLKQSLADFADGVDYAWRLEHEINERRKLEGALLEAKAKLELRIEERTRQLAESVAALERAQAVMAEAKALSDAVINSLPGVFLLFDLEERLLRCNDEFARLVSLPEGATSAHLLRERVLAEDQVRVAEEVRRAIETGQADFEARFAVPDGVRVYRFVIRSMHQNAQPYLVGMGFDITERKKAEEERALLATAIVQTSETVMITDAQADIVYVNPTFERTTGYAAPEVLGRNPRLLKSGRHDAAYYLGMWEVLSRGEVWRGRIVNKRKDGSLYEEEAIISPVRDTSGRIANYVALKHDITHQQELEAMLRQSQKLEAIGQLAGGVAHDFNNILAALMMNLSYLMENTGLDERTRKGLEEMDACAQRAANLTRQLLMFSRRSILEIRVLNLGQVIGNLMKMLGRLLGEHVKLVFEHAGDLPYVKGDAGMLEQVLMNLMVNARDAMPLGGQITLSAQAVTVPSGKDPGRPHGPAAPHVLVTVSDTGCGMDSATVQRVFEPFFTTKEAGKGTGLGLATVYGIIQQHQGWIEVSSEMGVGTTFRIFLPAAEAEDPAGVEGEAEPELRGGSERVLLVEDDEQIRLLAQRVLERYGYRVATAGSGEEALEAWRRQGGFDLLLSDLVLPGGLMGQPLAEQIRAEHGAIRVAFMSGYSADMAGREVGFIQPAGARLLQKPFQMRAFIQFVRECLDA
jgi:PAS domain S-box-containing protein